MNKKLCSPRGSFLTPWPRRACRINLMLGALSSGPLVFQSKSSRPRKASSTSSSSRLSSLFLLVKASEASTSSRKFNIDQETGSRMAENITKHQNWHCFLALNRFLPGFALAVFRIKNHLRFNLQRLLGPTKHYWHVMVSIVDVLFMLACVPITALFGSYTKSNLLFCRKPTPFGKDCIQLTFWLCFRPWTTNSLITS